MGEENFYSNREIFEKLTDKIEDLSKELTETQRVVKEYNGLRKQLNQVCIDVARMQAQGIGKNILAEGIVRYGGWVLAIASFLFAVLR